MAGEKLLGSGAARRAAEQLKRRREQVDEEEGKAMAKGGTTNRKTAAAFREVHANEPSIVGRTRSKFGAERAEKQRTAIALSKARAAGAQIPKPGYAEGGSVSRSDRMTSEAIMAPYSRQPRRD
jgi:hypothetical protein